MAYSNKKLKVLDENKFPWNGGGYFNVSTPDKAAETIIEKTLWTLLVKKMLLQGFYANPV